MNKKEIANLKKSDPVRYVLEHGAWRIKRGKRLSATLMPYSISNPKKAYEAAKEILQKPKKKGRSIFNLRGQTRLEEFLGVPPPHEPPWPGARRVPHTCYQWY